MIFEYAKQYNCALLKYVNNLDKWYLRYKHKYLFSSVRIWDYTQDACINVLTGHTAPVRGLMWNPEIPYLLISGSWDYTIKVWDTREGSCLDTVCDHGADVYGKVFFMYLLFWHVSADFHFWAIQYFYLWCWGLKPLQSPTSPAIYVCMYLFFERNLAKFPRWDSNLRSSCFGLSNVEVIDMNNHNDGCTVFLKKS